MGGMENTVTVLDYQAGKEVAAIEIGDWPTFSAISPDGRFLYIVNEESDNLVKVDTESNQPILRIGVGNEPSDAVLIDFPS
jgi:YVTN family beta-propeller protein